MINKIKEFLAAHPNSSIWTALICSLTAMSTDDWVSLLSAVGLFTSTIFGLYQKWVSVREERKDKEEARKNLEQTRKIELMNAENASERFKVETKLLKADLNRPHGDIQNNVK